MSQEATPYDAEEAGEVARLLSYVALLAVSAGLFLEARVIPTSRFEVLGAGAFPMLVHGVLMLLLLIAIVGSVRSLPGSAYGRFAARITGWAVERRLVFAVFGCLAVYLAAMPVIGYPIATLGFLLVLQIVLSPKTRTAIALAVALSILFSFGLNWLFAEVFNVFLPRGS
ncbi:Tripartite tricarboxylate transporter TctB family protein [Roseivivax sp. THAF40]|uniref:tripartite tricarboxylate transporter TctB family protein n=1 Tax=unclassified Roseivivax TaxID=2639302 RepID=UPI00126929D7|nr:MULTISPECIES: tripartite tricarboxylate transporter TctB family protein [unclassified Roseivivax]QFS82533.1 Tripartite tricarboxylate transporter TctB family protein [Roseivivax sp. THAF197b]QFT46302.1 Tripartite tricarboxylate transporter TctB family protein [Roseivivax sp. THAF40]